MKVLTFKVGAIQTNCYLVTDEVTGKAAYVDPGDDASRLLEKLTEKGLTLDLILLTHSHFDHILAVQPLAAATGARVAVHTLDAEGVRDAGASLAGMFGTRQTPYTGHIHELRDGDSIDCGELEFKVLHTPGHTRGSSCYICGGSIFSGDTLFDGDIGRTDLKGGSDTDMTQSLKKLKSLEGDYKVYPGHGNSTTLQRERAGNEYLRDL
ncbi:MAG: MBL fold metallo-hydrolase [Eubacteriales bacterium]